MERKDGESDTVNIFYISQMMEAWITNPQNAMKIMFLCYLVRQIIKIFCVRNQHLTVSLDKAENEGPHCRNKGCETTVGYKSTSNERPMSGPYTNNIYH